VTELVHDPYADDSHTKEAALEKKRLLSPFSVVLILIVGLMIGVVMWGIYQNSLTQPDRGPAPHFALPLLGEDGVFSLEAQEGSVVVVNFWGSWCGPCRAEAPMLQHAYEYFQAEGVVFVGVAIKDIERDSLNFIEEFQITYPNVMDYGGEVEDLYRVDGVPETFVIDRDGNIQKFFYARPREVELYAAIQEALKS